MERMVLLDKDKINDVIKCLDELEKIGKKDVPKEFKIPILQATNQIRTILGAGYWVLNEQVQLKA
ncbi:hypothetical protein ACFL6P_08995 [Candidatus Latescibacterota bacterium]